MEREQLILALFDMEGTSYPLVNTDYRVGFTYELQRGQFSAHQMASALWQHGPQMLAEMEKRAIRWPEFTGRQMADLIAALNSR